MFSKAEAYERYMGRWSRLVAPQLVAFADVRDADTVLDVGAGTGVLTRAVLDATATARVTGVDLSAEYVAYATQGIADPRARFAVADAQALQLGDAQFDRALSLLALNFVPDRVRAVAEMKRVTKPGGIVAAAVWDYGDGMEMLRVFWDEAISLDPAIEPRDERHLPLCRRGELGELWRRHGFSSVEEAPLITTLEFASFDDYWAPFLLGQGPAGAYAAGLAPDRQAALADRIRARVGAEAFELGARVWAVKGTRSES